MEWMISIEGKNEFGGVCRQEVRIDKSEARLCDGDLGLSIGDGKKIIVALQKAVVTQEAENVRALSRGQFETWYPRLGANANQASTQAAA